MRSLYAVVEFNQASGTPEENASVWDNRTDALDERNHLAARATAAGRREQYRVYQLTEINEDQEESC